MRRGVRRARSCGWRAPTSLRHLSQTQTTYMCICIYVIVCVYIYIYIYIHTHTITIITLIILLLLLLMIMIIITHKKHTIIIIIITQRSPSGTRGAARTIGICRFSSVDVCVCVHIYIYIYHTTNNSKNNSSRYLPFKVLDIALYVKATYHYN